MNFLRSKNRFWYIFGYGSLINPESILTTAKFYNFHIAKLKGFARSWYKGSSGKTSVVGIEASSDSVINGSLFKILKSDLILFDNRERSYDRVRINEFLELDIDLASSFDCFTYVIKKSEAPDSKAPLQLTYIDVIISGCLRIGVDFAREFIETTHSWDSF